MAAQMRVIVPDRGMIEIRRRLAAYTDALHHGRGPGIVGHCKGHHFLQSERAEAEGEPCPRGLAGVALAPALRCKAPAYLDRVRRKHRQIGGAAEPCEADALPCRRDF